MGVGVSLLALSELASPDLGTGLAASAGAQLERTHQILQYLHPSITERGDQQSVALLQFKSRYAQRSIGGSIKGWISPVGPKHALRAILDTIEPHIFPIIMVIGYYHGCLYLVE
jgi:hypothetical protein